LKGNLQNQYFNGCQRERQQPGGEPGRRVRPFQTSKMFDLKGLIEKANLKELGFSKDPITLRTQLNVNVTGNTVDELGRCQIAEYLPADDQ
jgi:hypothetical protein